MHDTDCLVNDKNPLWHRKAAGFKPDFYKNVLSKYKHKGISKIDLGLYSKFGKEVFLMTMEEITNDMIEKNIKFQMPNAVGGQLFVKNIHPGPLSLGLYIYEFAMKGFNQYGKKQITCVAHSRHRRRIKQLAKKGHRYV